MNTGQENIIQKKFNVLIKDSKCTFEIKDKTYEIDFTCDDKNKQTQEIETMFSTIYSLSLTDENFKFKITKNDNKNRLLTDAVNAFIEDFNSKNIN